MSDLTGRWMPVKSRGRMAIKVERKRPHWSDNPGEFIRYWVWADEEDLIELGFYNQLVSQVGEKPWQTNPLN